MRVVSAMICYLLICGVAVAQQPTTVAKTPEELKAIRARVADWFKTCLADWDTATHMTKIEWRAKMRAGFGRTWKIPDR
jgi:hypothetical protein